MEALRRSARSFAVFAGAAGGVLVAASPASAHPGHATTGFGSGFLHPLTGPDHLLAMVAVGIVAATWRSDRSLWLAPATFVGAMILGGLAGVLGAPLPGAEVMIAASVLLLGVAIAGALTDGAAANWVLPALAVAGIAHGHAHGVEAPTAVHPALFIAGFVLATTALHVVGVGVGTVVRDRRLVRMTIGAATASAGALLLLAV